MKRSICIVLIIAFLLCGCSLTGERIKEPVTFYYLCSSFQENLCCVVLSEEREASGHTGDLSYLLALYLMGPANDELRSPLPPDTKILSVQQLGEKLMIELSDMDSKLSDIDFSLAGACLTMTCLDISSAGSVTIKSGSRSVTMDSDSLSLFDSNIEAAHEEATK